MSKVISLVPNALSKFAIGENFAFNTIVSIDDIERHDMIYVYHLLHEGTQLQLKRTHENIKGDPIYTVYFKTFILGTVTIKGFVRSFYSDKLEITAEIKQLEKRKYLPIQGVDIQLEALKLKKVS